MEIKWWPLVVPCPKCGSVSKLLFVKYSANGELQFSFPCSKCKESVVLQGFASELQRFAFLKDANESKSTTVAPLLLPPSTNFDKADINRLHSLGIGKKEKGDK